jgi:hypothetical protein
MDCPIYLKDGTMCLAASSRPGAVGASSSSVAVWPTETKLLEAAKRVKSRLPPEMREQFGALFSAKNIAITSGVLGAWAASHACGVGEAADLVLMVGGTLMLGLQSFQVGHDIGDFIVLAGSARTEGDLDTAANHLARAVISIGVATLIGRMFKRGAALPAEEFLGKDMDWWLAEVRNPKAPPQVVEWVKTALKFFQADYWKTKSTQEIAEYLRAVDFSNEVEVVELEAGTEVIRYWGKDRFGMYYSVRGTAMDRLGIADAGRKFDRFVLSRNVKVLKSRAADIAGQRGSDGIRSTLGGGGTQYIIPDAESNLVPVK